MICRNDEHLEKVLLKIEVTDDVIKISINDEQPKKTAFLIEFTEDGIFICASD